MAYNMPPQGYGMPPQGYPQQGYPPQGYNSAYADAATPPLHKVSKV